MSSLSVPFAANAQRIVSFSVSMVCLAPITSVAEVFVANWQPTRIAAPPAIDGRLDDEIWGEVPFVAAFLQVAPLSGARPTSATRVALAYTDTALYFALVAEDAEPGGIIATQRRRDADLSSDDHFVLVLDPFLDRRNGYAFSFNALGAREDSLIRGGVTLDRDWDGLWEVEAKRTPSGWIAEGTIPFSTLSFRNDAPA